MLIGSADSVLLRDLFQIDAALAYLVLSVLSIPFQHFLTIYDVIQRRLDPLLSHWLHRLEWIGGSDSS